MEKIICIKKCISSKSHIAYENEYYYSYFEKISSFNETVYPTISVYFGDKKTHLGFFDARNFMTLAEYRDFRIKEIFDEQSEESKEGYKEVFLLK